MKKRWPRSLPRLFFCAIIVVILSTLPSTHTRGYTFGDLEGKDNPLLVTTYDTHQLDSSRLIEISATTTRVSVSSEGIEGNGYSYSSSISGDGRYVTFGSNSSNLVEGDTNSTYDVFIHDRQTHSTTLISKSLDGSPGNSSSGGADISTNGRYVAFYSTASNMVDDDANDASDVFVHDNETGDITLVSVSTFGTQANRGVGVVGPSISADGRYVAFDSYSDNLVVGDSNRVCYYPTSLYPTNCPDIFVHDRDTGITTRASISSDGDQGNGYSNDPDISADGRYVAFESRATNLVEGEYLECSRVPYGNCYDIFVHDFVTGNTQRISKSSEGVQGNNESFNPSISADGRYVAFSTIADNLVSGDTNGSWDIFVHDRLTGETILVSVSSDGIQGNDYSNYPAISADGRYVAFYSSANNLVIGDDNDSGDVFVHDMDTGETSLISVSTGGIQGNDWSGYPAISSNGGYIAYNSDATNLVREDTNDAPDVFVYGVDLPASFSITHLEVTQGIQCYNHNIDGYICEDNSVPLIAGKPTVVRAYLNSYSGIENGITGKLYLSHDIGDNWIEIDPENAPVYAVEPGLFQRDNRHHSLEFSIPLSLTTYPSLKMYVEAYQNQNGNNSLSAQQDFTFNQVSPYNIAYVPINIRGDFPDLEQIDNAHELIKNLFPVSDINHFPLPISFPLIFTEGEETQIMQYLYGLYSLYNIISSPLDLEEIDQLFGWIPHQNWGEPWGKSDPPFNGGNGNVAFGIDDDTNQIYQVILAHEVAHNLDRKHHFSLPQSGVTPCIKGENTDPNWPYQDSYIHEVGYDFGFYYPFSHIVPEETYDLMISSYCIDGDRRAPRWISAYTYKALFDKLQNPNLNSSRYSIQTSINPGPIMLISGRVFTDSTAIIDSTYQITATQSISQTTGSDYCLSLEDLGGSTLSSDCFDLSFENPDSDSLQTSDQFVRVLPFDQSAERIVLKQGNNVLTDLSASDNKPSIELLTPNGGEVIDGLVDVSWNANDSDGDSLMYIVSYSTDGGASWYHLGTNITDTHLSVDSDLIPGSDHAIFRITVSDGFNTSSDDSDGVFTVQKHPPKVVIMSPDEGDSISPGQSTLLDGYGYDLEDGSLNTDNLLWRSNLDGDLGTGKQILVRLSHGEHEISLSAQDTDGNTSTKTINIYVGYRVRIPFIKK